MQCTPAMRCCQTSALKPCRQGLHQRQLDTAHSRRCQPHLVDVGYSAAARSRPLAASHPPAVPEWCQLVAWALGLPLAAPLAAAAGSGCRRRCRAFCLICRWTNSSVPPSAPSAVSAAAAASLGGILAPTGAHRAQAADLAHLYLIIHETHPSACSRSGGSR